MIVWIDGKRKTGRLGRKCSSPSHLPSALTHAGETDSTPFILAGFRFVSGHTKTLWILVADDETLNRQLVLITNIPLTSVLPFNRFITLALATRIEHGYRFDRNKAWTLRICVCKRWIGCALFAIVLLAAQIIFVISEQWPPKAVLWIRQLGGQVGCPR